MDASPLVVVVSGFPATGKSTLAARLGADLGLPVVHRDRLRTRVFDDFADVAPETEPLIAQGTGRLVLGIVDLLLRARSSLVLDGNFNTPAHADGLPELIELHGAVATEICLWGDRDVLEKRFVERSDPPLTPELAPYLAQVLRRPKEPALAIAEVLAHVDVTDFAPLDERYPHLVDDLRRRLPRR